MITSDELFKIGYLLKPHGIKGEVTARLEVEVPDLSVPYFVCEMDGIFVPFFVECLRYKGSESILIKFERVENEKAAKRFMGKALFFPRKYLPEGYDVSCSLNSCIGYEVEDLNEGFLGTLAFIDDSTINLLLGIRDAKGKELLIPAVDDFIEGIDDKKRKIFLSLPHGLLDLNEPTC